MAEQTKIETPSVFIQLASIFGANKDKVRHIKEANRNEIRSELLRSRSQTESGENTGIQLAAIPGGKTQLPNPDGKADLEDVAVDVETGLQACKAPNERCVAASRKCRDQARLYRSLNILLIFLSAFLSPSAGIIAAQVHEGVGYGFACTASLCTILMFVLKWGQLSETYSGYCLEFRKASSSENPDAEYDKIVGKIQSGALNMDLFDDPDHIERGCCC